MIKTTLFSLILLIISCNSQKEIPEQTDTTYKLHDIWALKTIQGKEVKWLESSDKKSVPMLEIFVKDKRIGGNDSCNRLFGKIEVVTNSSIRFGMLGGTKMACPDMKLPSDYSKALSQTRSYKIEKLHLFLYDAERKEVLTFIKVD